MLGYIVLQFSHIRVYVTIPCYNPYYTGVSYCAMFYRINLRYVVFGYCIACYVKNVTLFYCFVLRYVLLPMVLYHITMFLYLFRFSGTCLSLAVSSSLYQVFLAGFNIFRYHQHMHVYIYIHILGVIVIFGSAVTIVFNISTAVLVFCSYCLITATTGHCLLLRTILSYKFPDHVARCYVELYHIVHIPELNILQIVSQNYATVCD